MRTICDTGPLVAYLNRRDPKHDWTVALFKHIRPPLYLCDAVLTEACYFLREDGLPVDGIFALLERKVLVADFDTKGSWPRLRTLMRRFETMDFADACVVAMTERTKACQVLTLDRKDFSIYRRNDRQVIDFIAP